MAILRGPHQKLRGSREAGSVRGLLCLPKRRARASQTHVARWCRENALKDEPLDF